jgi:hypothetical protein
VISTNRSCTRVLEWITFLAAHLATLHQNPHSTRSFRVHDLQAYRVGFDKYLCSSLEIDQTTAKDVLVSVLVVFLVFSPQTKLGRAKSFVVCEKRRSGSVWGSRWIRVSFCSSDPALFYIFLLLLLRTGGEMDVRRERLPKDACLVQAAV